MSLFVIPVKGRMVMNVEALQAKERRFIGYEFDGIDWHIVDDIVEVPNNAYYRQALKNGDLRNA